MRQLKHIAYCIIAIIVLANKLVSAEVLTDTVTVSGQVVSSLNSAPIPDHLVYMTSLNNDSVQMAITDQEGYFQFPVDTLMLSDTLKVSTIGNCFGIPEVYEQYVNINQSNTQLFFEICHVQDSSVCEAFFDYEIMDDTTVQFINLSFSEDSLTFLWEFGDSTTSTEENPFHIYSQAGNYNVCLTIQSETCTDIFCRTVQFSQTTFLFGHAELSSTSFPDCEVRLIPVDGGTPYVTTTDMDGLFIFMGIQHTVYHLEVIPLLPYEEYLPKLFPTYYGNALYWEQSNLTEPETECNINYFSNDQFLYGHNTIRGCISDPNSTLPLPPAILLLDESNTPVDFVLPLDDGSYVFENIPSGSYTIYPQFAGFTTIPYPIEIENDYETIENICFAVDGNVIEAQPTGIEENSITLKIYPQPANEILHVEFSEDISSYRIVDMQGRCVLNKNIESQKQVSIDTRSLTPGLYMLNIGTDDGLINKQLVVGRY